MSPARLWIRFVLTVLVTLLAAAALIYGYVQSLPLVEQTAFQEFIRRYRLIILIPPTLLLIAAVLTTRWAIDNVMLPLHRLLEALRIQSTVNPSHRLESHGSQTIRYLSEALNSAAERYAIDQEGIDARISMATRNLQRENHALAALITELHEGIIICNPDGRILLYNTLAQQLLDRNHAASATSNPGGGLVGLGRPIFGVIDERLIRHSLEDLQKRLAGDDHHSAAQFITTGNDHQLLKVQVIGILESARQLTGFILVVYDISEQEEISAQRDFIIKSLTEGVRSPLASIQAAIESVIRFPEMDAAQRQRFYAVINDEVQTLGKHINDTRRQFAAHFKASWSLERMRAAEFGGALQHECQSRLTCRLDMDLSAETLWIQVDSYQFAQSILFLVKQLQAEDIPPGALRIHRDNNFVCLDLVTEGSLPSGETLHQWEMSFPDSSGEALPHTVREILDRHDGDMWAHRGERPGGNYLRIIIPAVTAPRRARPSSVEMVYEERPEFYDFDLFQQPGQTPELDNTPLSQLTYTVFDTETTGLDPSAGDEIISLGAVRIFNNRMLRKEIFDQLVNPQRKLSASSIDIHGIQLEALAGQPTIEAVLPRFHRFAEETVLVAHNAAFDMRFLEIKQAVSGVTFDQPVLDTLLLSAAVHPNHQRHSLDEVAERLGILIIDRHTALGDARVTAAILLKLIPLLESLGIRTLRDAREISQKTFYARIKY